MTAAYIAAGWTGAAVIVCALFHLAKTIVQRNCPCEEVHP
jgi:hypothetical protein